MTSSIAVGMKKMINEWKCTSWLPSEPPIKLEHEENIGYLIAEWNAICTVCACMSHMEAQTSWVRYRFD